MDPERRHAQIFSTEDPPAEEPPAEDDPAEEAPAEEAKADGDAAAAEKKSPPVITAKSLLKHKPEELLKINDDHMNAVLKKAGRHAEDSHEDLVAKHKELVDLAHKLEAKA